MITATMIEHIPIFTDSNEITSVFADFVQSLHDLIPDPPVHLSDEDLHHYACAFTAPVTQKTSFRAEASAFKKLEFLGDSVVYLSATQYLMQRYPAERVPSLDRKRRVLVSNHEGLEELARLIGVDMFVEQDTSCGKLLASVMESLLGVMFENHGFTYTHSFLTNLWDTHIDHLLTLYLPRHLENARLNSHSHRSLLNVTTSDFDPNARDFYSELRNHLSYSNRDDSLSIVFSERRESRHPHHRINWFAEVKCQGRDDKERKVIAERETRADAQNAACKILLERLWKEEGGRRGRLMSSGAEPAPVDEWEGETVTTPVWEESIDVQEHQEHHQHQHQHQQQQQHHQHQHQHQPQRHRYQKKRQHSHHGCACPSSGNKTTKYHPRGAFDNFPEDSLDYIPETLFSDIDDDSLQDNGVTQLSSSSSSTSTGSTSPTSAVTSPLSKIRLPSSTPSLATAAILSAADYADPKACLCMVLDHIGEGGRTVSPPFYSCNTEEGEYEACVRVGVEVEGEVVEFVERRRGESKEEAEEEAARAMVERLFNEKLRAPEEGEEEEGDDEEWRLEKSAGRGGKRQLRTLVVTEKAGRRKEGRAQPKRVAGLERKQAHAATDRKTKKEKKGTPDLILFDDLISFD